ncbi:PDZ domain-containing protein [Rubrobacter marinus]|uniref:PDZ domain-containing protein n=1 Tax=Rubrobacter marinus TaxID=2653852 RepID=A0A6G8PXI2_9ACTN|nr:M50 family metallopeptidase [Rubrobacter marinus]QIN78931.1 PDZ domain-containing protein [Rubrobacter marinus]
MTVVVALLGLILLVVVHELGHMLVAKAMGVHVPEFGIGFGPAIFKKKFGKTVYSFRIILLGGFAKMEGMEGMASVEEETGERGPNAYPSKPAWRRAAIIFAGPFANLLAAVVIFFGVYMAGAPTGITTTVEEVVPDSLAAELQLRPGDRIVSAYGEPVGEWSEFQEIMAGRRIGDPVDLVVERGGRDLELSGELGADPTNPERAIVGIQPAATTAAGPIEAFVEAVGRTIQVIGLFGWFVGQLVTGGIDFFDSVSSPIGVVSVSSTVASQGLLSFANLLAFISLNLAVFNLLPILPLDGGHLFFIAAEKVIGRPVRPETIGKVAAFGLALILMLFVFATYADVSKIVEGQPFIPEQPERRP